MGFAFFLRIAICISRIATSALAGRAVTFMKKLFEIIDLLGVRKSQYAIRKSHYAYRLTPLQLHRFLLRGGWNNRGWNRKNKQKGPGCRCSPGLMGVEQRFSVRPDSSEPRAGRLLAWLPVPGPCHLERRWRRMRGLPRQCGFPCGRLEAGSGSWQLGWG